MSAAFTCAQCGGTFDKAWSDEEAMTEAHDNFTAAELEDVAVVCDDCYTQMMGLMPPDEWRASQERNRFLEQADEIAAELTEEMRKLGYEGVTVEFNDEPILKEQRDDRAASESRDTQ